MQNYIIYLQVVINCNVTSVCVYKKKSPDFHKFIDEGQLVNEMFVFNDLKHATFLSFLLENKTYGFGFYKKEESYQESEKFVRFGRCFLFSVY